MAKSKGDYLKSGDRLKVGDLITYTEDASHIREILKVRKTGYTWRYPDRPDRNYLSENSNDPFFTWNLSWKIASPQEGA